MISSSALAACAPPPARPLVRSRTLCLPWAKNVLDRIGEAGGGVCARPGGGEEGLLDADVSAPLPSLSRLTSVGAPFYVQWPNPGPHPACAFLPAHRPATLLRVASFSSLDTARRRRRRWRRRRQSPPDMHWTEGRERERERRGGDPRFVGNREP